MAVLTMEQFNKKLEKAGRAVVSGNIRNMHFAFQRMCEFRKRQLKLPKELSKGVVEQLARNAGYVNYKGFWVMPYLEQVPPLVMDIIDNDFLKAVEVAK